MSEDQEVNQLRRHFLATMTSFVGLAGIAAAAVPFVGSWLPSAKARASGAPVKVSLDNLVPGKMKVLGWRGAPIYILNRTPEMLASLEKDTSILADPDSKKSKQPKNTENEYRSIKPEILVVKGVCTHLGCAPKLRDAEFSPDGQTEFFCPCHGSTFDLAGRVYKKVPAPTNLEVPPYSFIADNVLLIGKGNTES